MSTVRERPILFSGEIVRAILEGRKTQTRRVVKPQRHAAGHKLTADEVVQERVGQTCAVRCHYGTVGDRLWVKETWRYAYEASSCRHVRRVEYKADGESAPNWKSPIFMRRSDSRLTLEVTGVRVERVQDISEEDAKAEGAERGIYCGPDDEGPALRSIDCEADEKLSSYRSGFRFIWECINGADSWNANPWVWVIEFRRVK